VYIHTYIHIHIIYIYIGVGERREAALERAGERARLVIAREHAAADAERRLVKPVH
jgi:hypothetical protein